MRRRNRLHANVPNPNRETGLAAFLDGLKRSQGNSVAAETIALVLNSVEMTRLSVNRLDQLLDNDVIRKDNAEMLDSNGFGFVTRLQLNAADDRFVKAHTNDWIPMDDDISYLRTV